MTCWFGTYWCGKSAGKFYSWHCFDGGKIERFTSLEEAKEKAWKHYQSIVYSLFE